jgi:predicted amidohydrolase
MSVRVRWLAASLLLSSCGGGSHPVPLRVAACQILVDGDCEAAFERIEAALEEAAAQGAQIACFPETCLFGWVNPAAHEFADPIPGPTTERLAALAQRHDMMLAVGLAEREGDRLYDSAVLIDRDGALLVHHRKVNILTELMDPPYTPGPGAASSFADTRLGRIGLLICADTFEETLVAQTAASSPDLVLVPYGWAAPAEDWPEHAESLHTWIAHTARGVNAPVLGVDSTGSLGHGPWKGFVLGGQSALSDATGKLSAPLADRTREVRVFEVRTGRESSTPPE